MYSNIAKILETIDFSFRQNKSHGKLFRLIREVGGIRFCPDEAIIPILRWLVLCYIGEPGGYGRGKSRTVFFSNTGAPLAMEMMKNSGKNLKDYLNQIKNEDADVRRLMQDEFDQEFKMYLYERGVNIDSSLFELQFQAPQNFATYRQAELDGQRVPQFQTMSQIPFMSKRFAMKRFLGMTDEELAENERLWSEENGKGSTVPTDSSGELRGAGISSAGIESDLADLSDEETPPDSAEMPGAPPAAAASPVAAPTAPTA
jgi:hypothetical protein